MVRAEDEGGRKEPSSVSRALTVLSHPIKSMFGERWLCIVVFWDRWLMACLGLGDGGVLWGHIWFSHSSLVCIRSGLPRISQTPDGSSVWWSGLVLLGQALQL